MIRPPGGDAGECGGRPGGPGAQPTRRLRHGMLMMSPGSNYIHLSIMDVTPELMIGSNVLMD